jgi:AcrR family transcriptional regulator
MPRPRRDDLNAATSTTIKETARQLMRDHGTAGLSLRAIARTLGMSASALYHYFPSLNDLITALIVDAFTGQAQAVRTARDTAAAAGHPLELQLFTAMLAYRDWALAHSIDFQLVYGNPIPGYTAPADSTVPAARAVGAVFLETLVALVRAGKLRLPPTHDPIPPTVAAHYRAYLDTDDDTLLPALHLLTSAWSLLHGCVVLEIYHHVQPLVGDTDAFYRAQVRGYLRLIGLDPEPFDNR